MKKKCCISGCDNLVQVPSTETCVNCYSSILRWSKRDAKDILHRAQRIGLFSTRLQILMPGNIEALRPKKIKLKRMPGQIKIKKTEDVKDVKVVRKTKTG